MPAAGRPLILRNGDKRLDALLALAGAGGGGSSGSTDISVATIADLEAVATGDLKEGAFAFVKTVFRKYVLDPTSTLTPDASFNVVAAEGGGNWLGT